ncbi:MAG: DUF2807 domain-containing protein [Bacteroidales bacterium]|nr:DUF2807 domain-containing protein [Bacteroidales bacterium]
MKTKSVLLSGLLTLLFVLPSVFSQANIIDDERKVGNFESIKISGAFDVVLIPSDSEYVIVKCEQKYLDGVETEVIDDVLKIYLNRRITKLEKGIKIEVYFKNIESIKTSGAVDVMSKGQLVFSHFEMDCSGATDVDLDLKVDKLEAEFSGASDIDLRGKAGKVELSLSGASELEAGDFVIENLELDASGASEAVVHVTGKLEAQVSGASSLRYKGNPESAEIDKSGVSSVKKI